MKKSNLQSYLICENSLNQKWFFGPHGFNDLYIYEKLVLWEFIGEDAQLRLITSGNTVLQSFSSNEELEQMLKGKVSQVKTYKIEDYDARDFKIKLENGGSIWLLDGYGYYSITDEEFTNLQLWSADKSIRKIINSKTKIVGNIKAKAGQIPEPIQLIANRYKKSLKMDKAKGGCIGFITFFFAGLLIVIAIIAFMNII